MRKLYLIALLLLALAFTACTPPLEKGYVYAKEYDPAWTQLLATPLTNCWGTGAARECITTYIFTPVYHPEQWYLDITSCNADQKQNCQTNEIAVDAGTYNTAYIGQYVDFSNQ